MADSTIGAKVDAWTKKKEKRVFEFVRWATRRMLRHSKMKAGISYRLSNGPRGGHRFESSPPGGYPGKRTGGYQQSIRSRVTKKGTEVTGEIFSPILYAKFLETTTNRPTMKLTLEDLLPEFRRTFARMVKK